MKYIGSLVLAVLLLVACGGEGQPPANEPDTSSHPWVLDPNIEIPSDRLAEATVLRAIHDLARDSGISSRDLVVEFQGTTRLIPEGLQAGFRSLSFVAAVFGDLESVESFVERLEQAEPYDTLVVHAADVAVNGSPSASVQFTVYTHPAPR
ncbi:MAG: hypothetical protein WD533_00460 [Dehalococcoidia bacterium]